MKNAQTEKMVGALVDRFKALRIEKGLSQEGLAEKAGLHRTAIGLLERKQRTPTIATCINIAKALDVSLASLLKNLEP